MYNIEEVKLRAIRILSVVCKMSEGISKEDACKTCELDINELNEFLKIGTTQCTNEINIEDLGLKKNTLTHLNCNDEIDIRDLGLKNRTLNHLKYTGINTVSDLFEFLEKYDLHTISGIGNVSIDDIIKCVKEKCNIDISFAINTGTKCTSANYDGRLLSLPLSLCGFTDHAFNFLIRSGYRTIEDLIKAINNEELEFFLVLSDLDISLENLGFKFSEIKDYCMKCRALFKNECSK